MTVKTLYLMRHGETRFNQLHRIQGASDSPLTATGIAQAQQARAFIEGVEFDHAYSSTQERASDTLEIVTDGQMPYQRLKGLKEYDFGVFEGQSEQLNPKVVGPNGYGDFFVQFGGESANQVAERMVRTITEIMNRPDNQQVLIVSHGGAIFNFARRQFDAVQTLGHGFKNLSTLVFTFETATQKFTYQKVLTLADLKKEAETAAANAAASSTSSSQTSTVVDSSATDATSSTTSAYDQSGTGTTYSDQASNDQNSTTTSNGYDSSTPETDSTSSTDVTGNTTTTNNQNETTTNSESNQNSVDNTTTTGATTSHNSTTDNQNTTN